MNVHVNIEDGDLMMVLSYIGLYPALLMHVGDAKCPVATFQANFDMYDVVVKVMPVF